MMSTHCRLNLNTLKYNNLDMKSEVTKEQIDAFLNGTDPMERIIKMECDYNDDTITLIYRDEKGKKKALREPFKPIVWTKTSAACQLFNGDRKELKYQMSKYGIGVKSLRTTNSDNVEPLRMGDGYKLLFYAKQPMTYTKFMDFFVKGGVPIYSSKDEKNYIAVAPVEQYMIQTGRRLFKGYNGYDELVRMQWDLETTGLNPETCTINQIGIRTNKGFERILTVGDDLSEVEAIYEFFCIIKEIKPDVISGHNTENFDWNFIDVRLKQRGSSLKEFSKMVFPKTIYKKNKQAVLKLGGETEYYYPTIMYGYNLTDSLFAVRRAQALNSNIKKADLKYITKFSKLNKPNRVYVPGKIIGTTWADNTPTYALNEKNGDWFKINDKKLEEKGLTYNSDNTKLINSNTNEEYNVTTGKYIVERYLLDDLYETDKVEHKFNITNFFICKMLPVSFERMCTMGTAAVWKYIMLAWSYENGLAVPDLIPTRNFVGGLSRLITVGYVDRIVKLDYNSLYPSIILSYDINAEIDIMGTMSSMLEYILTQREHYKGLKKKYGKECERLSEEINNLKENKTNDTKNISELENELNTNEMYESLYDNLQTAIKVIGNGFFGSYGSGTVFPWSDIDCAEQTTATGRQCLRLMISHFTNIGYTPIVGDSFTPDTPVFIKYNGNNLIDIKPISELINVNNIHIDGLNREYDYSNKDYKVLCRSGWVEPSYIYRHKTDKDMYQVSENDMTIEVTQDHSLFNVNKVKIKPTDIDEKTKLEYYNDDIQTTQVEISNERIISLANEFNSNKLDRLPIDLLNSNKDNKAVFLNLINTNLIQNKNKTLIAQIQFLNGTKN